MIQREFWNKREAEMWQMHGVPHASPSDVNNMSMKWLPKPNHWPEVVVMKFYASVCNCNKADGVKCSKILQ